ncbi:zinc-dependent peptidase [Rosistilla oblonga]|uniref:zinc-dependent peptidase n=1 Tax=Rosistilla oblonga TaxID=2527990 RepID=UPI001E62AE1D|nr:zinc-dependent peptidase [Rosistilla oblonga]
MPHSATCDHSSTSTVQIKQWLSPSNVSDCQYGRSHVINSYGAEHISEFFAVATETFFERPLSFRARHPELYEIFSQYYRQNPAARFDG